MRSSDIGIVKPLHATIVSSGAAPPTLRRLQRQKVPFWTAAPATSATAPPRALNLMVHLPELVKHIKLQARVPANYLPWGTEKDFSGTHKARHVSVRFSPGHTTQWAYPRRPPTPTRTPTRTKDDQFRPDKRAGAARPRG